ncbi:MAG TPA: dTDP-glucose 4,6-dehydratase [Chlamydiales bacterium]|nr:dTDP-glucose 4,6-dehydratase [Chlamydiales bacterium]
MESIFVQPYNRLLVTGGAGFIGSAFIRYLLNSLDFSGTIINLDLLTYAGQFFQEFRKDSRYQFIQGDIRNGQLIETILTENRVDAIVHFAAETHVDRSIVSARPFFETNVMGTLSLLEAVRQFPHIHFHHISTDEVYGSLGESGSFNEHSPYLPNSPYSASKAASDHLVRAFANTYGISTTVSYCSNNFGPRQFPEKFIPVMISQCLANRPLPVYGRGTNVRDWLYVDDHVEAIWLILQKGKKGERYNIGGGVAISNLDLLHLLIELLSIETKTDPQQYRSLITFVQDRAGHDFRYAMDVAKIRRELGWSPTTGLKEGLIQTIRYYLGGSIPIAFSK